jgi:hypothetical protein
LVTTTTKYGYRSTGDSPDLTLDARNAIPVASTAAARPTLSALR